MPSDDAQEVDAPLCKRCHQAYVVECGYEPSSHGFCWPCCDEIVEKLIELKDDRVFARFLADRAFDHFQAATKGGKKVDEEFEALFIMEWFLQRGTAPRE